MLGAIPIYFVTLWHPISVNENERLLTDLVVSGPFTLAAIGVALLLGTIIGVIPALRSLGQSITEGLAS